MNITQNSQISFTNLTKSRELFETLLLKTFKSESINGIKTVTHDLYPNMKFVGSRGYKYYALEIQKKVFEKYPEIAEDTKIIKAHIEKNPQIKKEELAEFVEPYIQKYGETIDITI